MITRSLALRHGRTAIPKPSTSSSIRQWRRAISFTNRRAAQEQQETTQPADGPFGLGQQRDSIVEDWDFFQHQRALTGNVGAAVTPHYKPGQLIKNPPRPEDITLELLLASQTHLGHRTSLWHPANARYIFGVWGQAHDAIHIISLDVTAAHLRRACKVVTGVAAKGGVILFVGTRDGHALPVVNAAKLAGGCHVFDKWIPGTLTNGERILRKCAKKVVNEVDKEMPGFESQLTDRAAIKPDLVICLNPLENYVLLHECGIHNIPTIGIVDTDVNPTWVTYPIPANDDSLRSVSVIAGALGKAGQTGQDIRLNRAQSGAIDFVPARNLELPTREEMVASKRAKDNLAVEEQDEDEEEILTAAEETMYAADEADTTTPKELEGVMEVDLDEEFHQSDEALVSLTSFAQDGTASSELSEDDMSVLAESDQSPAAQEQPASASTGDQNASSLSESKAVPTTSDVPGTPTSTTPDEPASPTPEPTPTKAKSQSRAGMARTIQHESMSPIVDTFEEVPSTNESEMTHEEEHALLAESVEHPRRKDTQVESATNEIVDDVSGSVTAHSAQAQSNSNEIVDDVSVPTATDSPPADEAANTVVASEADNKMEEGTKAKKEDADEQDPDDVTIKV